jgi:hypothetical protein
MAGDYLKYVSGKLTEIIANVTSAGAGDAGKLIKLDAGGKLDTSVLPTGVGAEVVVAPASENLAAGDFVNFWDDAGTVKVRKADASDATKPAHGFVLAAVVSPANATVYCSGINNQVSGMTPGAMQFLSTTAGGVTETAPSANGEIAQHLGFAHSTTELYFDPNGTLVVRAA